MKNDLTTTRGQIRSAPRAILTTREAIYNRRIVTNSTATSVINYESNASLVDAQRLKVATEYTMAPQVSAAIIDKTITYRLLAKTAKRASILSRFINVGATKKSHTGKQRWFRVPKIRQFTLASLAIVILAATGYVGFDTWQTNHQVKSQLIQSVAALSSSITTDSPTRQAAEGTSETKLPVDVLKNYHVAASLPRALYIDKLHIAARILPMGVNPDGSVQAPLGIYDSGWYDGSVKPGETGAMFIDGHASGPTRQGLFGSLFMLNEGDTLQVEKGDGTRLTYKVVHKDIVDKDKVDMKAMLLPYGRTSRALNLMTCAGTWVQNDKTLSQRVLIYAEQI